MSDSSNFFLLLGLLLAFKTVFAEESHYDGRFRLSDWLPHSAHTRSSVVPVRTSTKDLREIFIGRCLYFGNVMYTDPEIYQPKNCTRLWEEFHQSYTGRDECSTPEQNYYTFAESAYNMVKENRSAFWEGLQVFVDEFSQNGKRFIGISNTLTGYMLHNCAWCGLEKSSKNGGDDPCTFTWAPNCTEHSFWAAASRQYAREATGRVSLFLNAARPSVYNKNGLFTTHEFPQLYWPKNSHVDVRLVVPIGTVPNEPCGTGSLLELKTMIENKNMTMTCTHYPLDVTHYLCIDNPEAMECRLYYDHDCLMTVASGEESRCAYRNTASSATPHYMVLALLTVGTLLTFSGQ